MGSHKHKERAADYCSSQQNNSLSETSAPIITPALDSLVTSLPASLVDSESKGIAGEEEAIVHDTAQCVFCTKLSPSLQDNISHMTTEHSFFIPDLEFLVDIEGLVGYLLEKVCEYNICLQCSGKGRGYYSTEAVRKHMIDKGHCILNYDELGRMELSDFYDFRSSYPKENGDEWEDVENNGDEDDEGELVDMVEDEEVESTSRILANAKVQIDGMELVLANGARAGHRLLLRYYKQRFQHVDMRDSVVIQRTMAQYVSDI